MPSPLAQAYFDRSNELLSAAWKNNAETLAQLTPIVAQNVANGGVIHTFGSGHSELISREIIGRAGGLVCVSGIQDPTNGFIENLVGFGSKLVERYDRQHELRSGEIIIVISNSGKNSSPIEVAQYAKEKGLTVVTLSCLNMSRGIKSQHPSGKRLFECGDFSLDNGGVAGDAVVDIGNGTGVMAGPTSTLIGCSVLNWLMLGVIEWLIAHGHTPPLLKSQNLPGAIEFNRSLGARYKGRLSRQLA